MRRAVLAALAGLLAMAGQASANGFGPGQIDIRFKLDVRWFNPARAGQAGPWYLYWPLEAHFITPAHPQYPYWPSPQTLKNGEVFVAPQGQQVPPYWK